MYYGHQYNYNPTIFVYQQTYMFSNINNLNVHVFSRRAVLADLRAQRLIFQSLILFIRGNLSLNMSRIEQASILCVSPYRSKTFTVNV